MPSITSAMSAALSNGGGAIGALMMNVVPEVSLPFSPRTQLSIRIFPPCPCTTWWLRSSWDMLGTRISECGIRNAEWIVDRLRFEFDIISIT